VRDTGAAEQKSKWLEQASGGNAQLRPRLDAALRTPADTHVSYLDQLGFPGQFPYTRGVYPTQYLGRLWSMRQVSGFGTSRESNERLKYKMAVGETGLSVVFDIPTHLAMDSDDPRAEGEVGINGAPLDSLEDMASLVDGIPIEKVSVALIESMGSIPIVLACYIAVARSRGIPLETLPGTIQNDPLSFYICAPKVHPWPPRAALRQVRDIYAFCSRHMPRFNLANIAGYQIREAGATPVQEAGFALAHARAYIETGMRAGLAVDAFAPRLALYLGSYLDFFHEIAKFRAARRYWARMLRDRYGAQNELSMRVKFHTQTGANEYTAQEPYNNLIRGSVQAMAAVLAGVQSLNVTSFDEALGLPTEEAVRLSTRTQQLIAYETGVPDVIDPLGGSWYVEALTDRIEAEMDGFVQRIEEMGDGDIVEGVVAGAESGEFYRWVTDEAIKSNRAVQSGERVVVGVNRYPLDRPVSVPVFHIDEELQEEQKRRVQRVRRERDSRATAGALKELEAALQRDENMMPPLIAAMEARATIGEVGSLFREAFGEYQPPTNFKM
jgi:methylmalonyl-CoA mutase N-terminal domain/subunit